MKWLTQKERFGNDVLNFCDSVVCVSETIWIGFDYWRSDWDRESGELLDKRRPLDRVVVYDALKHEIVAELVGASLSLRNENMEALESNEGGGGVLRIVNDERLLQYLNAIK